MKVIEASDLTKVYRRGSESVHALKGVSLSVEAGEFISIVGPSGSGKTALLNLLGCLDTPTSGSLMVNGVDVTCLTEKKRGVNTKREYRFYIPAVFPYSNPISKGKYNASPDIQQKKGQPVQGR